MAELSLICRRLLNLGPIAVMQSLSRQPWQVLAHEAIEIAQAAAVEAHYYFMFGARAHRKHHIPAKLAHHAVFVNDRFSATRLPSMLPSFDPDDLTTPVNMKPDKNV